MGDVKVSQDAAGIIKARYAIYQSKRNKADAFADDSMTRWEVLEHTMDALEILWDELGLEPSDLTQDRSEPS